MVDDILNLTVQNIAQPINRFSGNRFPMFHPIQRIGRDAMHMNKLILGNSLFIQCIVKWLVADHVRHLLRRG